MIDNGGAAAVVVGESARRGPNDTTASPRLGVHSMIKPSHGWIPCEADSIKASTGQLLTTR